MHSSSYISVSSINVHEINHGHADLCIKDDKTELKSMFFSTD